MTLRVSRTIPALVATLCAACSTAVAEPSVAPDRTLTTAGDVIATDTNEPIEDLAALTDTSGRLVVVASGSEYDHALLSADGRRAVVARSSPGTTWLGWINTSSGEVTATVELTGDLEMAATDPDARFVGLVAVVDRAREPGTIAVGRTSTDLVVAGEDGETFRGQLAGNVVPEAFSEWTTPDGSGPGSAYVIEYQPAERPTHYRVRVLDLATGELGLPVNLRDKAQPIDQLMAGTSRTSVVAAGDGLLFTLYRGHHDEGVDPYAFIHTLAFGNGVWCLEVPVEMELAERGGALVMSPGGDHLVAVSANGTAARIAIADILDPEALPIFAAPVSLAAESDGVPAVAAGAAGVAVGLGSTVVLLDAVDLAVLARQELPIVVESLGATGSGFIAAGGGRLFALDESLTITGEAPVPDGLGRVARVVAG